MWQVKSRILTHVFLAGWLVRPVTCRLLHLQREFLGVLFGGFAWPSWTHGGNTKHPSTWARGIWGEGGGENCAYMYSTHKAFAITRAALEPQTGALIRESKVLAHWGILGSLDLSADSSTYSCKDIHFFFFFVFPGAA